MQPRCTNNSFVCMDLTKLPFDSITTQLQQRIMKHTFLHRV